MGEHLFERLIQKEVLFPTVQTSGLQVTGLAGWDPTDCLNNYKKGFKTEDVTLVDCEVKPEPFVRFGYIEQMPATPIMDCDYCRSIRHTTESLGITFRNISRLPKDIEKAFLFTFSVRGYRIRNFMNGIVYSETMDEMIEHTFNALNGIVFDHTIKGIEAKPLEYFEDNKGMIKDYYRENNIVGTIPYELEIKQSKFERCRIVRYKETCEMLTGIVTWH